MEGTNEPEGVVGPPHALSALKVIDNKLEFKTLAKGREHKDKKGTYHHLGTGRQGAKEMVDVARGTRLILKWDEVGPNSDQGLPDGALKVGPCIAHQEIQGGSAALVQRIGAVVRVGLQGC